jgi:hypothetical protein
MEPPHCQREEKVSVKPSRSLKMPEKNERMWSRNGPSPSGSSAQRVLPEELAKP